MEADGVLGKRRRGRPRLYPPPHLRPPKEKAKRGPNLNYEVVRSFDSKEEVDELFSPDRLAMMGMVRLRKNASGPNRRVVQYYRCAHERCNYICRIVFPDPALSVVFSIDLEVPVERSVHDHSFSERREEVDAGGVRILHPKVGLTLSQKEVIDHLIESGQKTEPKLVMSLLERLGISLPDIVALRNYIYYERRKRKMPGDGADAAAGPSRGNGNLDSILSGTAGKVVERKRMKLKTAIEAARANHAAWPLGYIAPAERRSRSSSSSSSSASSSPPLPSAALSSAANPAASGSSSSKGRVTLRHGMRKLDSLTTEELHTLVVKQGGGWAELARLVQEKSIDGLLLDGVESVEDLMGEDIGVERRLVANGILRRILLWKDEGVDLKM